MVEASIGGDTTVTVALALMVGGMIFALVRHMVKAEHNQDAQSRAIQEINVWKQQQQRTNEDVNLRLDRLERPTDERSHRTGRYPVIEDRER